MHVRTEIISDAAAVADVDRVISVQTWSVIAGVSYRTAKRMIAEGRGPKITRLVGRRVGVRLSAHLAWLAERTDEEG